MSVLTNGYLLNRNDLSKENLRVRPGLLISVIVSVIFCAPVFGIGGDMGVGTDPNTDGSEAYPWLIEDLDDFDTFADPNNAATYWAAGVHTQLMTDIDLSGRTYTTAVIAPDTDNQDSSNDFQGFPFNGVFDGNNFTISKLALNSNGADNHYLGLFGHNFNSESEVKNLGVEDIDIRSGSGSLFIGGICGDSKGAIIDCYTTGSVAGQDVIGGLCGAGNYIRNCYSICVVNGTNAIGGLCGRANHISNSSVIINITGSGWAVGGLCGYTGYNDNCMIENCSAIGSITGDQNVGGLCGANGSYLYVSIIKQSYAKCKVSGYKYVGGLCGKNYPLSTISNSYAMDEVTGYSLVGGLCGENESGTITNCYSTGLISSDVVEETGGLVGESSDNGIMNSFWDVETSGISDPEEGLADTDGMIGKITAEMMAQGTFTGWDFSTPVWMMLREGEDTPRLAWQAVFDGDIAGLYGVDLVDFAEIARNWQHTGCPGNCEDADIDGSGEVGISDLAYLAQDWLR